MGAGCTKNPPAGTQAEAAPAAKPAEKSHSPVPPHETPTGVGVRSEGNTTITVTTTTSHVSFNPSTQSEPNRIPRPEFANNRRRRQSVSSEVVTSQEPFTPNVIPKTPDESARINSTRYKCILFQHLDDNQWKIIVDAMFMVDLLPNQLVIKQGDSGDNFYVIDKGSVNIYIDTERTGHAIPESDATFGEGKRPIITDVSKLGKCVASGWGEGVHFGELALMYQQPRAASVVAATNTSLWAIDRATFRYVLLQTTNKKRQLYTDTLKQIQILSSLTEYERDTIADAVQPCVYEDGMPIIKEGEPGDDFYMIEEGTVAVTQRNAQTGLDVEVNRLHKSAYFGELAMLAGVPRQATVKAIGKVMCVKLDRECFTRLFGPLVQLMKERALDYKKAPCSDGPDSERERDRSSSICVEGDLINAKQTEGTKILV
eukprot:gnl/Hemi2/6813_TR2321_c0_g1_i1.p1 gnl/Hemi2/6813_TR2321_c0_g1~~gnl/Hemi2/6813_TR2321_c0_g1_i1.p1  ORF type:complete len:429 (-),score=81.04 gnl/Hemi2/6813_TR2321_c0_g1_i1:182-1468(-)